MSSKRRDYRDPHTGLGVDLTAIAAGGAGAFLLHEIGHRAYADWNHRDIISPYWRLHHNAASGNAIRSAGHDYPLTPDRIVITPAATRFDTLGPRTLPHLWLHFTPLQDFVLTLRQPVSIDAPPPLLQILDALRESAGDPIEDDPDFLRTLYHRGKAALHLAFAELPAHAFQALPRQLCDLLDHLHANLSADLGTPALARLVGMSPDRFRLWFREHLGESPKRYVTTAKMREAVHALSLTDRSIDEIAEALGYPNRYYFSRVFNRHLGCGPATFRRGSR